MHALYAFLPWRTTTATPRSLDLQDYMALYRQRRALRTLDAHLLADIGVSASAAEIEAKRPVWDVPGHWRA